MTHVPTVTWTTYLHPGAVYVNTTHHDGIEIGRFDRSIEIARTEARLLAKRINQCLAETGSRGKYGKPKIRASRDSGATDA